MKRFRAVLRVTECHWVVGRSLAGVRFGGLLVAALMIAACGRHWETLQPEGAGFVVSLPGTGRCQSAREETAWGGLAGRTCEVTRPTFSIPTGSGYASYSVSWFDLPAAVQKEDEPALLSDLKARTQRGHLREFERNETLRQFSFRQEKTTESAAELDGVAGLEHESVVVADEPPHYRSIWRQRMCIYAGRLYQVGYVGSRDPSNDRDWARVLRSFHFTSRE